MTSRRFLPRVAGAAALVVVLVGSPQAASAGNVIDEVKLGWLGHDVGFLGHHKESGNDVNAEVLFVSPKILSAIGAPRPHLGIDANSDGNTDFAYTGLTWTANLFQRLFAIDDGVFLAGSLGLSVNDGHVTGWYEDHKALGSAMLFRESAELGYRFLGRYSVSALLEHNSNAGLASKNEGITSAGARLGMRF